MTEASDQVFANWAQVCSAGLLLVGALIAIFTIHNARSVSRAETTFRYLERQDSAEFSACIASARKVWATSKRRGPAIGLARYEALDYDGRVRLIRVLNFYEELSTVYETDLFDDTVFRKFFAPTLMAFWLEAHWLILHLRGGAAESSFLSAWEDLYWKFKDEKVLYIETTELCSGSPEAQPHSSTAAWRVVSMTLAI